jgi:hypothetical protein
LKKVFQIAFFMLLACGCAKNPFSTRTSEPPLGAGGTWETPQSPEVTIRNLLFAYNEKVISNYELCLSDSFVFSAPEDSIDAINSGRGDLFADWDQSVEIASATIIFRNFTGSDTLSLFLTLGQSPEHVDIIEDSTAVLYRNYNLLIVKVSAGVPDSAAASGLATFHLTQEQLNWWTIRWWEDLPAGTNAYSWGDFKAEYRR